MTNKTATETKSKKPKGRKIGDENLRLYHTKHQFFIRSDEYGPLDEAAKSRLRKCREWFYINKTKRPNHNEAQHIRDYTISFDQTADGCIVNVECHHYSSVKPNSVEAICRAAQVQKPAERLAQVDTRHIEAKAKAFVADVAKIEKTRSIDELLADYKQKTIQKPAPAPLVDVPQMNLDESEPVTARNTRENSAEDSASDSSSGITEIEQRPPTPKVDLKLARSLTKPPLEKQKPIVLPVRQPHPTIEKQLDELEIQRQRDKIEEKRLNDEEAAVMKEKKILAELAAQRADRERRKAKLKLEKKKLAIRRKKLKSKDIDDDSDSDTDGDLDLDDDGDFDFGSLFTLKNAGIGFAALIAGQVGVKLLFGSGRQANQMPQLIQLPAGAFGQNAQNF